MSTPLQIISDHIAASRRREAASRNPKYRSLDATEVIEPMDQMRRGFDDYCASSNEWFPVDKRDVGKCAGYFNGSKFELRRPLQDKFSPAAELPLYRDALALAVEALREYSALKDGERGTKYWAEHTLKQIAGKMS